MAWHHLIMLSYFNNLLLTLLIFIIQSRDDPYVFPYDTTLPISLRWNHAVSNKIYFTHPYGDLVDMMFRLSWRYFPIFLLCSSMHSLSVTKYYISVDFLGDQNASLYVGLILEDGSLLYRFPDPWLSIEPNWQSSRMYLPSPYLFLLCYLSLSLCLPCRVWIKHTREIQRHIFQL